MKIKMLLVLLFIQGLLSLNSSAQVADFEVEMKSLPGSKLELKIKNNTSEAMIILNDGHRVDNRSYLRVDYKDDQDEILYSHPLSVGNRRILIIKGKETWTYTYQLHSNFFDVSIAKKIHLTLVVDYSIGDEYSKSCTKEFDLTYQK
ncbi:hypothetical protein [Bacteroides sp. 224]|uniref:hypothetical protein n=1 Tax=Bacteroides sp. 224 TaxID=2302936 RepID=UPI0013D61E74|nr:hypothetical protein [Bacteroides sp. 224]NDV65525.1 hypothetical protein [Bacteroides sp. 224]